MAKRHRRFKIRAADVGRIEDEYRRPNLRFASVKGVGAPRKVHNTPRGVLSADLREAMRAPAGKKVAVNGATLGMIMHASPWCKSNYPVMDEKEK